MDKIITVCIPHTFRDSFDYLAQGIRPVIGARVLVPFRKQQKIGIIIGVACPEKEGVTLKPIIELLDADPLITPTILALCQWISAYYQSPMSEVLPLALPKALRQGKPVLLPLGDYYQLNMPLTDAQHLIKKGASKHHELLAKLAETSEPLSKKMLLSHGVSKTQIDTLEARGIIKKTQRIELPIRRHNHESRPLPLNTEQAHAVNSIHCHLESYRCFLLQGVTGSGKTEVYLHVIATLLAANKQVLILVPEIGLTPQLLARFSARFDTPMVVLHSSLNETERVTAWQLAKDNHVKLVIGTRAAIFTPMPTLGLIIIDEEHDSSLKQMDGVRYSARDAALMRAHLANIPIILGTATPSLESINNCLLQKYHRLELTQKALTSIPLRYDVVDLRSVPIPNGLAPQTLRLISEHLHSNNQVLVFINRRGFSPVLLCHQCGWMAGCRQCDSHLTLHRYPHSLMCHHCGLKQPVPVHCKECSSKELIPLGSGTQRIHDYLQTEFPQFKLLRIDRDEIRQKNELNRRLDQITHNEVQLIVGTQMLAKGHHFPNLTLVVVLDTDNGFYNQDFRAIEQLGQLLTQVAGRAGRSMHPGQVVIQTHLPHHPLLNLLIKEGYEAFAKALLSARQDAQLPPYHYLAVIRAQHHHVAKVEQFLHSLKHFFVEHPVQVLGPAPAPLAKKGNQYRMQLLLKASARKPLQTSLTALRAWLIINKHSSAVRWNIDVDPQDLS